MEIVRETLGLPPDGYATDPRIEEIDLGLWDQLTERGSPRAGSRPVRCARGRQMECARCRAARIMRKWRPAPREWAESLTADTFAVSHGALTRILRGLFLGLDWQGMSDLDEPQGVVFRVRGR